MKKVVITRMSVVDDDGDVAELTWLTVATEGGSVAVDDDRDTTATSLDSAALMTISAAYMPISTISSHPPRIKRESLTFSATP